jgi:hypothetical protein
MWVYHGWLFSLKNCENYLSFLREKEKKTSFELLDLHCRGFDHFIQESRIGFPFSTRKDYVKRNSRDSIIPFSSFWEENLEDVSTLSQVNLEDISISSPEANLEDITIPLSQIDSQDFSICSSSSLIPTSPYSFSQTSSNSNSNSNSAITNELISNTRISKPNESNTSLNEHNHFNNIELANKIKRKKEKENVSGINNNSKTYIGKKQLKYSVNIKNPSPIYIQQQLTSFLKNPSAKRVELSGESKYKPLLKSRNLFHTQFFSLGKVKKNDINIEQIIEEGVESEDSFKDSSENLSTENISAQFNIQKTDHISSFENLQKKVISHYKYIISSKLLKTYALEFVNSMISTLYLNTFSDNVILKAIEKTKNFWNCILSEDDEKKFSASSYSFFYSKKYDYELRLNELICKNSEIHKENDNDDVDNGIFNDKNNTFQSDIEDLESEIIFCDFGARMNATVISEAAVERVFSKISHIINIHQLSISDSTLLGMINLYEK